MRDALGSVQSVLILGGTSEIGAATARALVAGRARRVVLAARNLQRAEQIAVELRGLGAEAVEVIEFDALAPATHDSVIRQAAAHLGDIDLALVAVGVLGDESAAREETAPLVELLATNFVGAASAMAATARAMTSQGHGTIAVLSSVAAERARRSNFAYGSSKAGLDAFAQGMGDSLHGTGVHVMVVRPGFVRTRMTAGRKAPPLSTTPDAVAGAIVAGLASGAQTVWVPAGLRVVMSALRHAPRAIFRRLPI
jgi:decaprenylphospho-beta-D-erythro-pentofuranosid-2-ulose 2-reductase